MASIERTTHDIYPFIDPRKNLAGCATGKTILVTGGSRGIGRAIAQHFAAAGASKVVITGRTTSSLEEAKTSIREENPQCQVQSVPVDMTNVLSVQKLYEELSDVPDVLVNNIGAANSQKKLAETDIDVWWGDWETNVKACFLSSRTYLRSLKGRPGVIINLSSSVSTTTSAALSSYAGAKTAINRLTEFIDLEYSEQGVQCIAFHPGGIQATGMGEMAPEYLKSNLIDTLDLAGGTAVFLSTPSASFLSGRFVYSNWNMAEVEKLKDDIVKNDLLKQRIELGDKLKGETLLPNTKNE